MLRVDERALVGYTLLSSWILGVTRANKTLDA